ncbi:hypothetical protein ABE28_003140 [Peribacillus muralis]|uniref:Uncharacterized protein n=1 Tax=Peribacillus muralis TaxID=264697 RepID=A0A1B3XJE0_9BACI|nr:hypothetical protein [Peribacillus muralis]AOH53334.1 hypothetical protein ABE28_003140 [Peribacillus muralis]
MAYSREEQETSLVFDNSTGEWTVYSTVPKHIRKLSKLTELFVLESEDDRPIAVRGTLTEKQVSMKNIPKKREMTEEQRQQAAERLSKARNAL